MSATDADFNNYTSLGEYNSSLNFIVGISGLSIDLNDNEYIRIRAYSVNEKQ